MHRVTSIPGPRWLTPRTAEAAPLILVITAPDKESRHRLKAPERSLVDRAPMNAHLGTDLAQGPALGIPPRRTLNVHGASAWHEPHRGPQRSSRCRVMQLAVEDERGVTPAHPTSTQQILELRDQGLTWTAVAQQVDMTTSDAWSRYRKSLPPKPTRLGGWQQVLADALDRNLAIGARSRRDHLGCAPTPLSSP
jgi:hypothetical protein